MADAPQVDPAADGHAVNPPDKSESPTAIDEKTLVATSDRPRGIAFWMVFAALCLATLLSALETTAIGTVLPTVAQALNGGDFVWAGSAFTLALTAFLPSFGGMANIWGRRVVMVIALVAFIAGSAICGAAQNMRMLIAGRTLQGLGSGGILSLTEIIVSDLVPLRDRGPYLGIIGMVWAISSAIGPIVGGALANAGQWRWAFYLNIPLGGLALAFVIVFLNLKTPKTNFREKMAQMDWIGNFIVIASIASVTIGLSWAGIQHPWSSAPVLAPLILGLAGLGVFAFWEAKYAKVPIMPIDLLSTRSAISGYLMTFWHGIISMAIVYYLPVYFQTAKGASQIRGGVDFLGVAFSVAPSVIVAGISIQATGRYAIQTWIGVIFGVVGFGLLSLLNVGSNEAKIIVFSFIEGIGVGIPFATTTYPILASVRIDQTATALSLLIFMRAFAYTWGITIGSTVLQNELQKTLPAAYLSQFAQGVSIVYAAIPQVRFLPEPLQAQVRQAFSDSLKVLWQVMIGIAGAAVLSALLMKEIPLHQVTDENWGFEDKEKNGDVEGKPRVNEENIALEPPIPDAA